MKKIIHLLTALFIGLLIAGCEDSVSFDDEFDENMETGTIVLNLERQSGKSLQSTPDEAQMRVVVRQPNNSFWTHTDLEVPGDESQVEITVPAMQGYIVEALTYRQDEGNSGDQAIYAHDRETSVNVSGGETTQVSLNLQPLADYFDLNVPDEVPENVGNITIEVINNAGSNDPINDIADFSSARIFISPDNEDAAFSHNNGDVKSSGEFSIQPGSSRDVEISVDDWDEISEGDDLYYQLYVKGKRNGVFSQEEHPVWNSGQNTAGLDNMFIKFPYFSGGGNVVSSDVVEADDGNGNNDDGIIGIDITY